MEEKLLILKMLEEGKITVEQADKLLDAVKDKKEEIMAVENPMGDGTAKWLRVRVYAADGSTTVKVNVPLTLVDVGLKLASSYDEKMQEQLKGINLDEIIKAIKDGAEGKLVDIETETGEKVEVTVE